MTKIYFTSDLHFGHANVIGFCDRPFSSVDAMNEGLIANWNGRVNPNDIIYILGDVFFCDANKAIKILNRLNGKKRIVFGNHDKKLRNNAQLLSMFDAVLPDLYMEYIDGIMVHMCHFPLLSWNKAYHGSFMLHGHVHSKNKHDGLYRRYDVGVDANNYTPVSWDNIRKELESINPNEQSEDRKSRAT